MPRSVHRQLLASRPQPPNPLQHNSSCSAEYDFSAFNAQMSANLAPKLASSSSLVNSGSQKTTMVGTKFVDTEGDGDKEDGHALWHGQAAMAWPLHMEVSLTLACQRACKHAA